MGAQPQPRGGPEHEPDPLLDQFWEDGLVLLGDRVREEYGLRTPIFIDLRHKLYEDLAALRRLGCALHEKLIAVAAAESVSEPPPQQVIGIPDTATALALATAMSAQERGDAICYGQLRKRPAAYPGGKSGVSSFMGTQMEGREITLIDDVMASGRTKRWALDELKKDGLTVKRVLVVVDREQGGDAVLRERGIAVHSLYTVSQVIRYYAETGKISEDEARQALDHLRSRRFE